MRNKSPKFHTEKNIIIIIIILSKEKKCSRLIIITSVLVFVNELIGRRQCTTSSMWKKKTISDCENKKGLNKKETNHLSLQVNRLCKRPLVLVILNMIFPLPEFFLLSGFFSPVCFVSAALYMRPIPKAHK